MRFKQYEVGGFFDEIFGESGEPRAAARTLVNNIELLPAGELLKPATHRRVRRYAEDGGGRRQK